MGVHRSYRRNEMETFSRAAINTVLTWKLPFGTSHLLASVLPFDFQYFHLTYIQLLFESRLEADLSF